TTSSNAVAPAGADLDREVSVGGTRQHVDELIVDDAQAGANFGFGEPVLPRVADRALERVLAGHRQQHGGVDGRNDRRDEPAVVDCHDVADPQPPEVEEYK